MDRIPLKMFVLCDSCNGACCKTIGVPPFILRNPLLGPSIPFAVRSNQELLLNELDIFLSMPEHVIEEHAAKVNALTEDPTGDPCFWLGEDGRCSQYEYRPVSCRIWEAGDSGCLAARAGSIIAYDHTKNCQPHIIRNPKHRGRIQLSYLKRIGLLKTLKLMWQLGLRGCLDLLQNDQRRNRI